MSSIIKFEKSSQISSQKPRLYRVKECIEVDGLILLCLDHQNYSDMRVACMREHHGDLNIDINDKIEFTLCDIVGNGRPSIAFPNFGGLFYFVKDISLWKDNTVFLPGAERLRREQSRFTPRPK